MSTSTTENPDGLLYEGRLYRGLKFHYGAHLTAEDDKLSVERQKGTGMGEFWGDTRAEAISAAP